MAAAEELVVYTVLTGPRERLGSPFPPNCEGFERICFTDDPKATSDDWSIVLLESARFDHAREARRIKHLPHLFLPELVPGAEWSLYVDNTVRLKVDPLDVLRRYRDQASPLVCFRHPWRDCIYDEGEEIVRLGYDDPWRVREQLDHYRSVGYPRHAGLAASTILLRRHLDPHLTAVQNDLFEHVLRFSKRDQLAFDYVAWRHGLEYATFPGELTENDWFDWIPRVDPPASRTGDFDPQEKRVTMLEEQLESLLSSESWRFTAPLRFVGRTARRLTG